MVSDFAPNGTLFAFFFSVLILVVMEYGLWHMRMRFFLNAGPSVLILVVMEYGLWPTTIHHTLRPLCLNPCCNGIWSLTGTQIWIFEIEDSVLILVVMEYGLWQFARLSSLQCWVISLNPCCNGIWSLTEHHSKEDCKGFPCLNPCCNGIWSLTWVILNLSSKVCYVLILVVMEYGLWPREVTNYRKKDGDVLILVVMEYGLWLIGEVQDLKRAKRLNPCCNGIWSLTEEFENWNISKGSSLNPCCNGIWSLTFNFYPSTLRKSITS